MQSQFDKSAVRIDHGVQIAKIDTVSDRLSLTDERFPLIGGLAQFTKNRFDEILVA
jgi:hypothetical protein